MSALVSRQSFFVVRSPLVFLHLWHASLRTEHHPARLDGPAYRAVDATIPCAAIVDAERWGGEWDEKVSMGGKQQHMGEGRAASCGCV